MEKGDKQLLVRMALIFPYMGSLFGSFWLIDHVLFPAPEYNQWQQLFVGIGVACSLNYGLNELIKKIESEPKKEG